MRCRLKELREKHGLNQTGMALILSVSQQTISRVERGDLRIPIDLAVKASKYFEVTVDYFLGITDEANYAPAISKAHYLARQHEEFFEEYMKLSTEYQDAVASIVHRLLEIQESGGVQQSIYLK